MFTKESYYFYTSGIFDIYLMQLFRNQIIPLSKKKNIKKKQLSHVIPNINKFNDVSIIMIKHQQNNMYSVF